MKAMYSGIFEGIALVATIGLGVYGAYCIFARDITNIIDVIAVLFTLIWAVILIVVLANIVKMVAEAAYETFKG